MQHSLNPYAGHPGRKEPVMATTTITLCPLCRAEAIPTPRWEFSDTSVEVSVCGTCRRFSLDSVRVKMSGLRDLMVTETDVIRHRDGLVSFTG
jgi:hypothetical protein